MADSEHNVKININGDSASAVGALSRVKTALGGIRTVAASVSRALGWIHLAANGINMLVQGFTWLKDKITETSRETRKMRWDFEMKMAADETARLVGWHEKLAKIMKDELDTMQKQRAVEEIERNGKKDYEDGRREAERARQIFEAKTPEEEQALKDKFEAEDEQRERYERKEERRRNIRRLEEEEAVYESKAESLKRNNSDIDQQLKDEKFNLYRVKDHEEYAEPIRKRIEALEKRKAANAAEIEQFEKEKAFRREQISALESQKDYDGPTAGEWNRRTEANKRAEEKAKEETGRQQKLEDARLERQKQEALAALDPKAKDYEFQRKEVERLYATRAAEDKVARADNETEKKAAEEELEALKIKNAAERRGDLSERELRQADDAERFADRVAAAEGVSQNRLTAMGLGSGVQSDGSVASNVMKIVDLLRRNVEATENINAGDGDGVGVYGE